MSRSVCTFSESSGCVRRKASSTPCCSLRAPWRSPDSYNLQPMSDCVESAVTGSPVVALCGKVWQPSRDPGRFPVCPECKEIFEGLPPGGGDGPEQ